MKSSLMQFFSSNHVIALSTAAVILVITIFLVARRWIGFSTALILLLFSLAAGIIINNPQIFENYTQIDLSKEMEQQEIFKKQIFQAIDGLKGEVQTEKDNLLQLKDQVQNILVQLENQKQKVENFIDETRKNFQKVEAKLETKPDQEQSAP